MKIRQNTITAVAGKGGTGKTTITALLIRLLREREKGPVLAVDADPSACLGRAVGMRVDESLGTIREESLEEFRKFQPGLSKKEYLEMRVQESIAEGRGLDLLSMGRPEGPGCYCFINSLIRESLDRLSRAYPYIVIDCEAGLEHFSRRTAAGIDYLCMVTTLSSMGIATVGEILDLTASLKTEVGEKVLFLNRMNSARDEEKALAMLEGIPEGTFSAVIRLPDDENVTALDLTGGSLFDLDGDADILNLMKEKITVE
jgi:CO dehydrogenase maturation factor